MKRLIGLLTVAALFGLATSAMAGDFHVGASLVCSDCHVAHDSQSHGYSVGGTVFPPLGTSGPYADLLRNDPNALCLACHDNQSWAPDVLGANGGTAGIRRAGGLTAETGHGFTNDVGYDGIDGHTLYSTGVAPGGTFTAPDGLECVSCHAQHGIAAQYRNLLNRSAFAGKNLTYVVGTNDLTKDVFERSAAHYKDADVDFNEPDVTKSAYGAWCSTCHVDFHGSGGAANMGGASGGTGSTNANPWKRHPTADVNIGASGSTATYISSLSQFNSHTNKVKVMDSQGLWDGTTADNTVTPSCFSCHRGHGTQNAFGLIFMKGTGTATEDGDGGQHRDLCRQCHTEGA
jgi:hypothetical protein